MGDALHDTLAAAVHQQAVTFPEPVPGYFSLAIEIDLEDRFSGIAATTGDHFQTLDQTRPR
ncbi:hypothetical protein [Streptomyces sp. NPDC001135]